MLTTVVYPDLTRDVRYFDRLIGHYAPVRYKRTNARAWRVVTVLGSLGYARTEADAKRLLVELAQC
jgi:hypothetical protein